MIIVSWAPKPYSNYQRPYITGHSRRVDPDTFVQTLASGVVLSYIPKGPRCCYGGYFPKSQL